MDRPCTGAVDASRPPFSGTKSTRSTIAIVVREWVLCALCALPCCYRSGGCELCSFVAVGCWVSRDKMDCRIFPVTSTSAESEGRGQSRPDGVKIRPFEEDLAFATGGHPRLVRGEHALYRCGLGLRFSAPLACAFEWMRDSRTPFKRKQLPSCAAAGASNLIEQRPRRPCHSSHLRPSRMVKEVSENNTTAVW